jgi:hypothetical protein
MFPIIGPEMVAALLRPCNESEESIENVKPRTRPQSTNDAKSACHRRLRTGTIAAGPWIRFKVIVFSFCRRVSDL